MKKIKLFLKEIGNFLTNFLCPLISIILALMELLHLPITWISAIKKVEYWLWNASGTKKEIEKIVEEVIDRTQDEER